MCSRPVRMKQKITTCVVYMCAVCAAIFFTVVTIVPADEFPGCVYRSTQLPLIASASALLIASIIIFRWPRISHWIGLISGLGALYWFYGVEFGYLFPALNTWVAFNLPDTAPDYSRDILIAKLKIVFAITALAATTISATRLLPARWMMRKRPVRNRLWPALAVCVLAALFWYSGAV